MGGAAARVAINRVRGAARGVLQSGAAREETRLRIDQETADQLLTAMTQLRGAALKLGQMLAEETDWLPEVVSTTLRDCAYRVRPIEEHRVERLVRDTLGDRPGRLFQRFENPAFAAASIGQVHRATSWDGQALAVKVQYPGVADAITRDLQVMRGFVRLVPQPQLLVDVIDELGERLGEELDYLREGSAMEWFADRLEPLGVRVPRPVWDLTRSRILTMTRLDGLHIDDWLQTSPDQDAIDDAAQAIYDAFSHCAYQLGVIHADPNQGNYLFDPAGRLGIVDFGCVKKLSDDIRTLVADIIERYANGDEDTLSLYRQLGLFGDLPETEARAVYEENMKPFEEWLIRPIQQDVFDFGARRGFAAEGRDHLFSFMKFRSQVQVHKDLIFMHRTYYGMFRLFERMGARVRMRLSIPGNTAS